LIHILGFFAALAWFLLLWGVCCLADGFFLFASGVGLSLFACWFIGVGPVPWSGSGRFSGCLLWTWAFP
jgi:hypothetical protein